MHSWHCELSYWHKVYHWKVWRTKKQTKKHQNFRPQQHTKFEPTGGWLKFGEKSTLSKFPKFKWFPQEELPINSGNVAKNHTRDMPLRATYIPKCGKIHTPTLHQLGLNLTQRGRWKAKFHLLPCGVKSSKLPGVMSNSHTSICAACILPVPTVI